jgi:hypothetical protein
VENRFVKPMAATVCGADPALSDFAVHRGRFRDSVVCGKNRNE